MDHALTKAQAEHRLAHAEEICWETLHLDLANETANAYAMARCPVEQGAEDDPGGSLGSLYPEPR